MQSERERTFKFIDDIASGHLLKMDTYSVTLFITLERVSTRAYAVEELGSIQLLPERVRGVESCTYS